MDEQIIEVVEKSKLLSRVLEFKKNRVRLVQICCTKKDGYEIAYTFDDNNKLINLILKIADGEEIDSVSQVYSFAFLYENEMHDLFGIKVKNMNIDFNGHLYKTSVIAPFK